MPDKEMIPFEEFWTTEQMDYALLGNRDGHYSIVHLPTNMDVTIEDDDVFSNVIQKMISAGNQRFTIPEYKTYRQKNNINRVN